MWLQLQNGFKTWSSLWEVSKVYKKLEFREMEWNVNTEELCLAHFNIFICFANELGQKWSLPVQTDFLKSRSPGKQHLKTNSQRQLYVLSLLRESVEIHQGPQFHYVLCITVGRFHLLQSAAALISSRDFSYRLWSFVLSVHQELLLRDSWFWRQWWVNIGWSQCGLNWQF